MLANTVATWSEMDSYTATETLWDSFGTFAPYNGIALGIVATAMLGLWLLGRRLGFTPWHWVIAWTFCVLVGEGGMLLHRALSGYLLVGGLQGVFLSLWLALRRGIPEARLGAR